MLGWARGARLVLVVSTAGNLFPKAVSGNARRRRMGKSFALASPGRAVENPARARGPSGMSWIRTIDQAGAEEPLAGLYARLVDPRSGQVDHILRVHSLNPRGLEAHVAVYRAAMAGTPGLALADRELIAYGVSRLNGCHY